MSLLPPPETTKQPARGKEGRSAGRAIDRSTARFVLAFRFAFAGLWHLLRTQRNAQVHLLIAACAVALGAFLPLARWEWLALILTIALVLAAEGVNTAVEAAVDLAAPHFHPLAKVAKDVAAGTVLLCAICAVLVGCIVFLPHLMAILEGMSL
jgi:diacylglycerol kinase (ATP)